MIGDVLLHSFAQRVVRRGFSRTMKLTPARGTLLCDPAPERALGLYIHIPFCESLCPFCSFHRVHFRESLAGAYFKALRSEILELHHAGYRFDSLYVGGGTPTVAPEALCQILGLVGSLFAVKSISVETHPDHLRREVLSPLLEVGVNRLSVGVQSFDDSLLKAMLRYDRYGSGEQIIERLRRIEGQFETLNVDMIFNLPGQTMASLQADLDHLTQDLKVDQISYYPLMTAQSTMRSMRSTLGEVTFNNERRFYEMIHSRLEGVFQPTTVWNFSRGSASIDEYIVQEPEYVGAGSGAFSYLRGTLSANSYSIAGYIEAIQRSGSAVRASRRFGPHEQVLNDLLMSLFGLDIDRAAIDSGDDLLSPPRRWAVATLLRALRLASLHQGRLVPSRRGRYFVLVLMREFFIGINNIRDQMRAIASEEESRAKSTREIIFGHEDSPGDDPHHANETSETRLADGKPSGKVTKSMEVR